MSEKVLAYWIHKFDPFMRVKRFIYCDEFLYFLLNTTCKTKLVEKQLTK